VLDLRNNELGDAGIDVVIRSFLSLHYEYLQELHLANNKISDAGFGKLMRTMQSLQQTNMPFLTRLSLEGNGITGKAKREFYPLPSYLSC
jgi:Ran GTPase-activating protein (RanGAP) involved in mRNA processing and transport